MRLYPSLCTWASVVVHPARRARGVQSTNARVVREPECVIKTGKRVVGKSVHLPDCVVSINQSAESTGERVIDW